MNHPIIQLILSAVQVAGAHVAPSIPPPVDPHLLITSIPKFTGHDLANMILAWLRSLGIHWYRW